MTQKLGITTPVPDPTFKAASTAIVIAFSGYFGRSGTNVWEWIKAKGTA